MIAPPVGVKPTTPCVLRDVKHRPLIWVTMPDGQRQRVQEYRAVYAAVHGWPAIEGRMVEHACDNGNCVRYGHLRLGDAQSNMTDMIMKGRKVVWNRDVTHCKHGHEFTEENTYVTTIGKRSCRECMRGYQREYQRARRARSKIQNSNFREDEQS